MFFTNLLKNLSWLHTLHVFAKSCDQIFDEKVKMICEKAIIISNFSALVLIVFSHLQIIRSIKFHFFSTQNQRQKKGQACRWRPGQPCYVEISNAYPRQREQDFFGSLFETGLKFLPPCQKSKFIKGANSEGPLPSWKSSWLPIFVFLWKLPYFEWWFLCFAMLSKFHNRFLFLV